MRPALAIPAMAAAPAALFGASCCKYHAFRQTSRHAFRARNLLRRSNGCRICGPYSNGRDGRLSAPPPPNPTRALTAGWNYARPRAHCRRHAMHEGNSSQ
ncbi:exported hypothetical protein [Cupriavidus taiwanensis]|uniref:Lipoprotein n=1 Tax=Cupriavidus taiwanensis TaxID=164546 RepID=A0A375IV48_9BURK|nr:exported hypothetical protein [Cupriavidus taiwanensis]